MVAVKEYTLDDIDQAVEGEADAVQTARRRRTYGESDAAVLNGRRRACVDAFGDHGVHRSAVPADGLLVRRHTGLRGVDGIFPVELDDGGAVP